MQRGPNPTTDAVLITLTKLQDKPGSQPTNKNDGKEDNTYNAAALFLVLPWVRSPYPMEVGLHPSTTHGVSH